MAGPNRTAIVALVVVGVFLLAGFAPGAGALKRLPDGALYQDLSEESIEELLAAALGLGGVRELFGTGDLVVKSRISVPGGSAVSYLTTIADLQIIGTERRGGDADYTVFMFQDAALTLINAQDRVNTAACLINGGYITMGAASFPKQVALRLLVAGMVGEVAPCAPFGGPGDKFVYRGAEGTIEAMSTVVFVDDFGPTWQTTFICTLGVTDRVDVEPFLTQRVRDEIDRVFVDRFPTIDEETDIRQDVRDQVTVFADDFLGAQQETTVVLNEWGSPIGFLPPRFADRLGDALDIGITFDDPPAVLGQDPEILTIAGGSDANISRIRDVIRADPRLAQKPAGGGGATGSDPDAPSNDPTQDPAGGDGGGGTQDGADGPTGDGGAGGDGTTGADAPFAGIHTDNVDLGIHDLHDADARERAFLLGVTAHAHAARQLSRHGMAPDAADGPKWGAST